MLLLLRFLAGSLILSLLTHSIIVDVMVLNVNHIIVSDNGSLGHLVKVVSIASSSDFFEVL